MLVSLIKGNKINKLVLPNKIVGNYWITETLKDIDNKIINIEAINGNWCLISNEEIGVIENNEEKKYVYLKNYAFYLLKVKENNSYLLLYCSPVYDDSYKKYSINNNQEITIGNSSNNYIYYNNSGVDDIHAKLIYFNNKLSIVDNNSRLGIYVNDRRVHKSKMLENGDIIFIAGLKIIVSIENGVLYVLVNNPDNLAKCRLNEVVIDDIHKNNLDLDTSLDNDMIKNKDLYKDNEYILKKYRTKDNVEKVVVDIKEFDTTIDNNSNIIGTMFILFFLSAFLFLFGLFKDEFVLLIIGIIVFIGMCVWPLTIKLSNKIKNEKKKENYLEYLNFTKEKIKKDIDGQRKVLVNNTYSIHECEQIILNRKSNLWERKNNDSDFLNISLGTGIMPANISVSKEILNNDEYLLKDVPINISLQSKKVLSLIGNKKLNRRFLEQIIIQLVALHSYDDLKIVMLTDEDKSIKYDYFKLFPHLWSNDKRIRFYGNNKEDINVICEYLLNNKDLSNYIIITDNINKVNNRLIDSVINTDKYPKYNFIILDESLINIPKGCNYFIRVNDNDSIYYENCLNGINIKFKIDFSVRINMHDCAKSLANVPIKIDSNILPKDYSILQMYESGQVEHLNVYERWNKKNFGDSLKASVGITEYGELVDIDLLDDRHILIIGLPGSGKTQFLITYILSLCINYNPCEVQFIVLEEEQELKDIFFDEYKLPHLSGIYNYDSSSLKRFMTTFKAELTKRRKIFIDTERRFNEKHIDINKYQQLFNNKQVDISMNHLFIIIDEYDKLEKSHPKFVESLLKVSHISSTLGVHFVFTIDKHNIVDDDFINIFGSKIMMYDIGDNRSILNEPGCFYLNKTICKCANGEVNYNPSYKYKKNIDSSIDFINNIGTVVKNVNKVNNTKYNGTEIYNIIKYLSIVAKEENINANSIYLDKLCNYVTVASLMKGYNVSHKKHIIEPVIGEYENLTNHVHNILRPSLSYDNVIIHSIDQREYENVISSMLFSSMYLYTPFEVNYHIIDMNGNSFTIFKNCPLVGDIISSDENDKVEEFFNILIKIKNQRIECLKEYGGDYNNFCKNNKEELPLIIIIINNFNVFNIKHKEYVDELYNILDSDIDYGIRFVLSISEVVSSDLLEKFNTYYALKQINNGDYNRIFNDDIINYPEENFGRGLTKVHDSICEFQTAFVNPKNKDYYDFVREQCVECSKEFKTSVKILNSLPSKITFKNVRNELGKSDEMIIGYNNQWEIIKYNFIKHTINVICGEKMDKIANFVQPLIKQFAYLNKTEVIVFNALEDSLASTINNLKLINSDFDYNFNLLEKYIKNLYSISNDSNNDVGRHRVIFVYGLSNLRNKLNLENKNKLGELIELANKMDHIHFVIIDSESKLKSFESEIWYKDIVNGSSGIWIGKGINVQNIFKLKKYIDNDIEDNECYVIECGIPIFTQYVESFDVLEN